MCVKSRPFKTARCILHRNGRYLLAVHSSCWGACDRRWGVPGGAFERGESPIQAVRRELNEELSLSNLDLTELGVFQYKKAQHMVFAAPLAEEVTEYSTSELLDVGWFSFSDVTDMHRHRKLHAYYELDAINRLRRLSPPAGD